MNPTHPHTAIADYQIVEELGAGNHGHYYVAVPPQRLGLGDELVVIKVFSDPVSEDGFRRGVRELRTFAAVRSTYLVRVYDAVLEGKFLYAMEHLPMGSLAAAADSMSRDHILRAVEQAARAVHDLHEAGMVHGDVTPSNILMHETGAKLSDLGLARVLDSTATLTGIASPGSIEFTDRALILGAPLTRGSDIWSLGATLHRAMAGVGLYGELPQDQPVLAVRTVLSQPPSISECLDAELTNLVRDCLSDTGAQPSTALEVADRIAELRA